MAVLKYVKILNGLHFYKRKKWCKVLYSFHKRIKAPTIYNFEIFINFIWKPQNELIQPWSCMSIYSSCSIIWIWTIYTGAYCLNFETVTKFDFNRKTIVEIESRWNLRKLRVGQNHSNLVKATQYCTTQTKTTQTAFSVFSFLVWTEYF